MKSLKTLLIIVLMALFTGTATAQKNPDKMAERRTKAIAKELKLDQQQYQKLLTLNKKMVRDRKSLKGKAKKTARVKARKDHKAAVKAILSAEQFIKWKQIRKEQ